VEAPVYSLLDKVIGHETQKAYLRRLVDSDIVPHAILFSGPAGVGKRTLARAFAAVLLLARETNAPVDTNSLKLIKSGTYPDLHLVFREEGKRDIAVESVREITSKLRLTPYCSKASVAIIDNAHFMNSAAANALLMTLEEPIKGRYLFLITDSAHRLPETIVSRCQVVHFSYLSQEELSQVLSFLLSSAEVQGVDLESLLDITDGSLAALGIEPFIDQRTLGLVHPKGFSEQLKSVLGLSGQVHSMLESLCTPEHAANPVSAASTLAGDKDFAEVIWPSLISFARKKLRLALPAKSALWSDFLEAVLGSQQRARERATSLNLELTSLFLMLERGGPPAQ